MLASHSVPRGVCTASSDTEWGSGGRGMTSRWRCGAKARRLKPHRPGAPAVRHWGPVMAGAGDRSQVACSDLGLKRWLGGLPIRKERQGCLKGKTTGGAAEQTYKHRARDAIGLGGLAALSASISLDIARCRGPRVHQDPWRPARPRFLSRAREWDYGLPGAAQRIRAAKRWLFEKSIGESRNASLARRLFFQLKRSHLAADREISVVEGSAREIPFSNSSKPME